MVKVIIPVRVRVALIVQAGKCLQVGQVTGGKVPSQLRLHAQEYSQGVDKIAANGRPFAPNYFEQFRNG